jgi:signal transduction histidine kinase
VHRIVTDYSGTIQVSSTVGSGTTMRVRLPGQHEVAEGHVPRPAAMRSAMA